MLAGDLAFWSAADEGTPYAANPVNFDGTSDYLALASDYSGNADSKLWTCSFWIRRTESGIIGNIVDSNGSRYRIYVDGTDNKIYIVGNAAAGTALLAINTSAIADTNWHHVMFSVDMADTGKRHLYVDNSADLTVATYTDGTIDFTRTSHRFGSNAASTDRIGADFADVQMWFGAYVDLSVAGNRQLFIDAGTPVDPATAAASLGTPTVRLSGATDDWHTNKGSGGGFTETGAISNGTGPVEL